MVHRRRGDRDQDLSRTGRRVRALAVLEDLVAPVLPEEDRFHRVSSSIPAISISRDIRDPFRDAPPGSGRPFRRRSRRSWNRPGPAGRAPRPGGPEDRGPRECRRGPESRGRRPPGGCSGCAGTPSLSRKRRSDRAIPRRDGCRRRARPARPLPTVRGESSDREKERAGNSKVSVQNPKINPFRLQRDVSRHARELQPS